MRAFDLLTDKDIGYIDKYISSYGDYGGYGLDGHANVEHLLRSWNDSKTGFLLDIFGNQLILEREIDIMTPESIIWKSLEDAIYPEGRNIEFISNYYNWMNGQKWELYECLSVLIGTDSLADNTYKGKDFEISVPGKKHPLCINHGCKAVKAIGKIAQAFSFNGFEEFRQKHSMALNQKKFKGTLCLSIHPLDYMTMSDNDSNWDSCMSWRKPGEYREGTVEMMNSPYVIVAYLKHDKDMDLFYGDEHPWNNKRWRQLFVVSPAVITSIKGYPFNDRVLEKEVFKWLMELAKNNCPSCHYDPPREFCPGERFEYYGEEVAVRFSFNIMYDDFGCHHTGYFSPEILDLKGKWDVYCLELSGDNICMCCGKSWEDTEDWDTQSLICPDCTGEVKCSSCGSFLSEYDAVKMRDGSYLCDCCVNDETRNCNFCDELEYKDNTEAVYLEHDGEIYLDEVFHLCNNCMCDKAEKLDQYYGKIESRPHPRYRLWMSNVNVINSNNLTLNGFNTFGYYARTIEEAREML